MRKLLLVFFLLIGVKLSVGAGVPAKKDSVKIIHRKILVDSTAIVQRQFNGAALKQYSSSPDFKYDTETSLSWWDRFWRWFWRWIAKLFDFEGPKAVAPIVKYIIGAVAVSFIVYSLIKYMGADLNIFRKDAKQVPIPYSESLENIHEISFDQEIEKAMAQHNYKLAVRLLYLRSLKQLSDAGLIHWQTDKTNSAYLNEIADSAQRQSFSILTIQFEYVWYGDFPVDGRSFQNIYTLFQDFKKMLS